ncbi:hypothetical protein [Cupriavidus gilardii]|uniref:hypothetical protein n=1 Tax=Cupriavidus gilardii TaxID=82541 RepID=UPI0021B36947|nr:hypothetical protein [Cupriavidus gilardii]UXC35171.1 hypothetical protein N4G38_12220 [Cupriavidus gilardii]
MLDKLEPIESPDGKFHDGNPVDGTLGTIVKALWLNAVQDAVRSVQGELINLITGLGGQLDPAKEDQIKTLLANALAKKANLESPELTGTPKAPTAAVESNSTAIANTEHVVKKLLRFGIGGGLATAVQFADLFASNDANDANITGIYTLVGTKNAPNGTSVMLHIERRFGAGVTAIQLSANAENLVFRTRVAAAWNTWRTVADVEGAANKVSRTGDIMSGTLTVKQDGTHSSAITPQGTVELARAEGAFIDFKTTEAEDFDWRVFHNAANNELLFSFNGGGLISLSSGGNLYLSYPGGGWISDLLAAKVARRRSSANAGFVLNDSDNAVVISWDGTWCQMFVDGIYMGALTTHQNGKNWFAPVSVMHNNGIGSYRLDNSANNPPVGPGSWEDRGTVNAGGGMLVRLLCRIA